MKGSEARNFQNQDNREERYYQGGERNLDIETRISKINEQVLLEQIEHGERVIEELKLVDEILKTLELRGGYTEMRFLDLLKEMENEDGEIEHVLLSSPRDTGRIGKMTKIILDRRQNTN